jgi:hypothetical protein
MTSPARRAVTKRNYPVGYGKPPKKTQFKKGESGNPKGRPKGAPNVLVAMKKELDKRHPVTENGRTKQMSKAEIIAKRLTTRAAQGNDRATDLVFKLELDARYQHAIKEAERAESEALEKPDLSLFTPDELLILRDLAEKVEQRKRALAAGQRDESDSEDDGEAPGKPYPKSRK